MGALVGKGWGRTKVFNKSIEGALGCLAACLLWALVVAEVSNVPLPVLVVGAVVATVVEVLPIPLDDNMGITLAAGYAMKLLAV